jgi:hypothetical protein
MVTYKSKTGNEGHHERKMRKRLMCFGFYLRASACICGSLSSSFPRVCAVSEIRCMASPLVLPLRTLYYSRSKSRILVVILFFFLRAPSCDFVDYASFLFAVSSRSLCLCDAFVVNRFLLFGCGSAALCALWLRELDKFSPKKMKRNTFSCVICVICVMFLPKTAPIRATIVFRTYYQHVTSKLMFAFHSSPFTLHSSFSVLRHSCVICVISLCRKGLQRNTEEKEGIPRHSARFASQAHPLPGSAWLRLHRDC